MILINFLPSEQKEKAKWHLINRFMLFYCSLSVAVVIIFIGILFVFSYFLTLYRDDSKMQIEKFEHSKLATEVSGLENKIKEKNKEIDAVSNLQKSKLYWSKVLEKIALSVPQGVTIINITSTDEVKILMSGHAARREQLLEFKSNLEDSEYFSGVSLPFADLTKRTDLNFNFTLILKEDILKKNQ